MKDKKVTTTSQHGFMKRKCCLTSQTAFYDKTTSLADEGGAMDVFYLNLSADFDTDSCNILIDKQMEHDLYVCSEIDWKPAEWLGPDDSHQRHKVQLEASH